MDAVTWLTFLPYVMLMLSVLSAIGYALIGDLKNTVYWAAAAAITFSVKCL